ncbi:MAG: hypothetical protein DRQ48_09905 [Gammaproteobacteria bacterium]|nr:MAG: hypothetical protein DRQ48_09905 [Gammaproteobacteria bacterium]
MVTKVDISMVDPAVAPIASPALTGNPTATTQNPGNDSTRIATTAFVASSIESAGSPAIDFITGSGYNSMFVLINGKIYQVHGSEAGYPSATTGAGIANKHKMRGVSNNFTEIAIPSNSPVVKTGGSYQVGFALLEDNDLFTWGNNGKGQCGLGNTSVQGIPQLAESDVTDVYWTNSCSGYNVTNSRLFIKKTDGYIYAAGHNLYGQLGLGDTTNRSSFIQITALGTTVTSVWNMGTGYGMTVAQKSDDTIWVCGYGGYGQLGNAATTNTNSSFVDVTTNWGGGTGYTITKVIGGYGYYTTAANAYGITGILLDNGTTTVFKMSGYNSHGQLGDTTTTNRSTPVTPNVGSGRHKDVVFVGALGATKCLMEDNDLYSWGYNNEGEVGDTTTTHRSTPSAVEADVTAIFCDGWANQHYGYRGSSFITKTDGLTYACGYNNVGQLGVGDISNKSTYTKVLLPWDFNTTMVGMYTTGSGHFTSVFVNAQGKMFATGSNAYAGIYSEHTTNIEVPVISTIAGL